MSRPAPADALVSTDWLAAHLSAPDVRVVDASWFFPGSGQTGRAAYDAAHIPGAVFFDIDEIKDETSPLPHIAPSPVKFASRVRKLGIGNGNRVIIYDRASGSSAAARVWWSFRLFGHQDVALLDGGLVKWQTEMRAVEDLPPLARDRHFIARVDQTLIRDKQQMLANLKDGRETVLDARSTGRFTGLDPEPWPHHKVGHIPGSHSLPWTELIDPQSKCFLPPATLRDRFAAAGVSKNKPVVTSCGSGVTACLLAFGLFLTGRDDVAVYDGSWAEWGLAEDTPAEQGPAL
jgi:thiosulfate/3-mercaptopyruvate sulfurtransferase